MPISCSMMISFARELLCPRDTNNKFIRPIIVLNLYSNNKKISYVVRAVCPLLIEDPFKLLVELKGDTQLF
jgi:hypothetical protein